ncbi:hypothetical protein KIH81_09660 [Bifidobacterium sp. 82T25]|nr:hypothetical protein [Bifidobacterium miconisargentati]
MPIISYDCVTGPAEVAIDGRNGYLVVMDDSELFSKRLDAVMSDGALLTGLSRNAWIDRECFAMARIGERWDCLIDKLN